MSRGAPGGAGTTRVIADEIPEPCDTPGLDDAPDLDEDAEEASDLLVRCARCGRTLVAEWAMAWVGRTFLCWRCATPDGIRTYWLFDRQAEAHRRLAQHAIWGGWATGTDT